MLQRHISMQSPESRQRRRDEILSTTMEDIKLFGNRLGSTKMHAAVFGSKNAYEKSSNHEKFKLFSDLF